MWSLADTLGVSSRTSASTLRTSTSEAPPASLYSKPLTANVYPPAAAAPATAVARRCRHRKLLPIPIPATTNNNNKNMTVY